MDLYFIAERGTFFVCALFVSYCLTSFHMHPIIAFFTTEQNKERKVMMSETNIWESKSFDSSIQWWDTWELSYLEHSIGFGGGFGNGNCWCSAAVPRAYLKPAGEAVGWWLRGSVKTAGHQSTPETIISIVHSASRGWWKGMLQSLSLWWFVFKGNLAFKQGCLSAQAVCSICVSCSGFSALPGPCFCSSSKMYKTFKQNKYFFN